MGLMKYIRRFIKLGKFLEKSTIEKTDFITENILNLTMMEMKFDRMGEVKFYNKYYSLNYSLGHSYSTL